MATRSETFDDILRRSVARRGVALMGVCNVTPDSFSDGGMYLTLERACARVDQLVAEGADFIDIGAESTRPGAAPVPPEEQLGRMLGVVGYAAGRAAVSVDTASPPVAAACLEAGAVAVNDVSCLADPDLAAVASAARATLVLMHSRGPQEKMRGFSQYPDDGYGDVVTDVVREWMGAAERAMGRGVPRSSLLMDPGLGFAKNAAQSAELLRRTSDLVRRAGVPVLVGASRKSFLTVVDSGADAQHRVGASLAAALYASRQGASVLRVHDVQATRQAIDLSRLLDSSSPPGISPTAEGTRRV